MEAQTLIGTKLRGPEQAMLDDLKRKVTPANWRRYRKELLDPLLGQLPRRARPVLYPAIAILASAAAEDMVMSAIWPGEHYTERALAAEIETARAKIGEALLGRLQSPQFQVNDVRPGDLVAWNCEESGPCAERFFEDVQAGRDREHGPGYGWGELRLERCIREGLTTPSAQRLRALIEERLTDDALGRAQSQVREATRWSPDNTPLASESREVLREAVMQDFAALAGDIRERQPGFYEDTARSELVERAVRTALDAQGGARAYFSGLAERLPERQRDHWSSYGDGFEGADDDVIDLLDDLRGRRVVLATEDDLGRYAYLRACDRLDVNPRGGFRLPARCGEFTRYHAPRSEFTIRSPLWS